VSAEFVLWDADIGNWWRHAHRVLVCTDRNRGHVIAEGMTDATQGLREEYERNAAMDDQSGRRVCSIKETRQSLVDAFLCRFARLAHKDETSLGDRLRGPVTGPHGVALLTLVRDRRATQKADIPMARIE